MFTEKQCIEIKNKLKNLGIRQVDLANLFGVKRQMINGLLNSKYENLRLEKMILDKLYK